MRDAALRTRPVLARRLVAAALVAVMAAGAGATGPAMTTAAEPNAAAAARFLAQHHGGGPADQVLVYERDGRVPASGEPIWVGKFVDARSGELRTVYRDRSGTVGDPDLVRGKERAALARLTAWERKASPQLRDAVARASERADGRGQGANSPRPLPVVAWLDVDLDAAETAVRGRHPEVSWAGRRPLVNDLATVRQLRAELWQARREAIAAAAAALRADVERAGGRVAYVSTSAPMVFMDLDAAVIPGLAERADVRTLGLEGGWQPAMSAAGPAVEANWTSGDGDQGAGIRVGVVEYHNVRRNGDLSGKVVKSYSTSGTLAYSPTFDHPTWVAGAIAGQSGTYRGVAPGASIVSAGTGGYSPSLAYDRAIIAAADWAVSPSGGDADIVNTSLVQDTATGAEEARRYFDSIVDRDGRLAVSAAGNYVNLSSWAIGSPGTGYNVLTVGGVDDRGTSGRSDDRIWYVPGSNGSNWLDRPSDPWNPHGDYNKPNLVAPAVAVRTANGLAASGTSVATPIVAGVAAQVMANEPILAAWPEAARAVLMAGSIHRVPMPDGSRRVDHEGVGMISAVWANRAADAGDNRLGGYRLGELSPGQQPTQEVEVIAGDRLRVALAWNSQVSGSGNLDLTDRLRADLDLRVTDPNGNVVGSWTLDNAYEFVEVTMPSSGTARIQVLQARFDGSSETYGLAWVKVRDTTAPTISRRVPQSGEPWAVPSALVTVTFNEAVTGVSRSSVRLLRLSTGERVPASVSYRSSTRTATLVPDRKLKPGRYRVAVRSEITDLAGNRLPVNRWTFRVTRPARAVSQRFSSERRIVFEAGTHIGYRFGSGGAISGSKSYDLTRRSGAHVSRRRTIPGVPGFWLKVTDGIWAGYWIRESRVAGLRGTVARRTWASERRFIVSPGTHVGYRYDSDGNVVRSKSVKLTSTSGAHADRRAVINGAWHLHVTDGTWAGYWLPESGLIYVRGRFSLSDLGAAWARMSKGTRTAYRYDAHGTVIHSRSLTLSSASGAPARAWAIINGRPSLYIEAGGWAGYWLPETSGVWLP
ncbi:MAG TPA: S8 family serine peptidase [Candidatus Limnocylindria bacterium]